MPRSGYKPTPHPLDGEIAGLERRLAELKRQRNTELWSASLIKARELNRTPAANAKKSAAAFKRWENPAYRARVSLAIRAAKARKRADAADPHREDLRRVRVPAPRIVLSALPRDEVEAQLFRQQGAE